MRALAVFLSLLFLTAQPALATDSHTPAEDHHEEAGHDHEHGQELGHDEEDHHAASAEGISALHAWVRATDDRDALLFVEIDNGSDREVTLLGGETAVAEGVELVGFRLKDGEPGFDVLPGVPLKPGKELLLAPNGLALRLNGLKQALHKGEEFEIEIEFDFGHIEMHAQIEAGNATQHSHAGHQH